MNQRVQLVIFDLDGTLTLPVLDFDRIRAEIGLASGTILETLEGMSPQEQVRAYDIIARHEQVAAENSSLQDGVHEVFDSLRQSGILLAIATRNSRKSAQTVLDRHVLFVDLLCTREDGAVKPSPEPVLKICQLLSVLPKYSWVVGDYLYDIQSGRQAGSTTVLMLGDRERPEYADQADHVIGTLPELINIIEDGKMK